MTLYTLIGKEPNQLRLLGHVYLRASTAECQSIPLIYISLDSQPTLSQHVYMYTLSTLDQHSDDILIHVHSTLSRSTHTHMYQSTLNRVCKYSSTVDQLLPETPWSTLDNKTTTLGYFTHMFNQHWMACLQKLVDSWGWTKMSIECRLSINCNICNNNNNNNDNNNNNSRDVLKLSFILVSIKTWTQMPLVHTVWLLCTCTATKS